MSRIKVALVLLFAAGAARAQETLEISDVVQQAMIAAERATTQTSSPTDVKMRGDALQRSLERTRGPKAGKYNWAVEPGMRDSIKSEDVSELINASARYIGPDRISVSGPTTHDMYEHLKQMQSEGRVRTASLPGRALATFHSSDSDKRGFLTASRVVMKICRILKPRPCAAFLYHEIGHAMDGDLHHGQEPADMERVVREESVAFIGMQKYLRGAYESDRQAHEMFATSLMELEALQRNSPHPIINDAIGYIRTINAVYGAVDESGKPDEKKLSELVRKLYKADGSPAATSA